MEGSEDCLFMDITVPRQGPPGEKKAVMVWIHGGAFSFGAGSTFIGTPLAVMGDVVMVTFNYRIGMLGFLYDGPGMCSYTTATIYVLLWSVNFCKVFSKF